ncbi:hypothetical protein BKA69DRAFT_1127285 [Paraphysoderma sedebokerense]|nr:hypothetical protein BKA69DRAFT_1127285 [Paraphysoderma sedebokerense]
MSLISECSRKRSCKKLTLTPLDFWDNDGLYRMCRYCRKRDNYSGPIFEDVVEIKTTVESGILQRLVSNDGDDGFGSDDKPEEEQSCVELKGLVKVHSTATVAELTVDIKNAVESADGCLKTVKNKDGSQRSIYWCCQRSEFAEYKPPIANPSRNRISMNRYNCKGSLVIYTPPDLQIQPLLYIQYYHGCFHPQTGRFKVSDRLKSFIREKVNSSNATAKEIYADFIKNKGEFREDALITQAHVSGNHCSQTFKLCKLNLSLHVYRWWYKFSKEKHVTDENQDAALLNCSSETITLKRKGPESIFCTSKRNKNLDKE